MRTIKTQHGVTLVEVLVTLVILSVALTGIAAVQATSMQSASQVKFRSAAISSAQTILDVMRTSRFGSTSDNRLANLKSYVGTNTSPPSAGQAKDDYSAFKSELSSSLRNRQPTFEIKVSDDREVTVIITWLQREEAESKDDSTVTKTYSVSARL